MEQINYSIYALYSVCGYIYIGISKNPQVRIQQHYQNSSNSQLRKLIENPNIEILAEILASNLSEVEADEYEKYLIAYYRADGMSQVLNIQDGGLGGSIWGENHSAAKISDKEVVEIREAYKSDNISVQTLADNYKVSTTTIHNIISGKRSPHLPGPISTSNLDKCKHYKLSDEQVMSIREKYSKFGKKIIFKNEAQQYGISGQHLSRLLRGVASPQVAGPILGKDYTNG